MIKEGGPVGQITRPAGGWTSSPHDALFRDVLGVPANAASLLRSALPPELTKRLDLDRLARCPGSFVDEALQWRHADLLYTVPLYGQDKSIYVLMEHQSKTHPMMARRVRRYIDRIWDRHERDDPGSRWLPAVIPLVVHHNKRPWRAPTELRDLIGLDPRTAEAADVCLPRFRFLLYDLARIDEQTLRELPLTRPTLMTALLLKTVAGNYRLIDDLRRFADDFTEIGKGPNGLQYLTTFVTYIQSVGNTSDDELRDLFSDLGPEAEKAYMTTAEQIRAAARIEAQAEILLQQLSLKFGLSPDVVHAVNNASPDQLATWTGRILTADTLDDVFS